MCTTATSDQDSTCPGSAALTRIRDHLMNNKFEVSSPLLDGTHLLRVVNAPLALCEVTIGEQAAQWYYQPYFGHPGAAGDAVAMVTAILGFGDRVRDAVAAGPAALPSHPHLAEVIDALAGSGLLMRRRDVGGEGGLGELAVDNPDRPDRGTVWITSDHAVIWESRRATSDGGAEFDFPGIADMITRALAAASH